uniref:Reverse transcriptase domain-containing protein n=1 Tax=Graphocephala atropunctata TaxID=36148 RepID=A0A1B6M5P8_9HEMI
MLQELPLGQQNNFTTKQYSKQISNFRCPPIGEKELLDIFNTLKNKWSSGYDEVPIKIIKLAKVPLIKPLLHLVNSSLISGIFPSKLKISRVVPVLKKGDQTDIQNYRPVSILPSTSKIFEKAMYIRLTEHLEKNELFDEEQHGFRKNRSTTTALVSFTESLIESIDKKNKVAGIFMDLSKAFDSISHSKLVKKLQNIGIKNNYLKWFESYLSNRHQFVEISKTQNNRISKFKSKLQRTQYGVPQGSILGPLLFICYIQDMPGCLNRLNGIKNELCLYADDSNLIMSAKTSLELKLASFIEMSKIQNFS